MEILTISGSARAGSSNIKLLKHLSSLTDYMSFQYSNLIKELPLFIDDPEAIIPEAVIKWRNQLAKSDGIIICTPEYIHNQPALLKNALEWVTASGEMAGKKVLAITFTPNEPRGEKAMQSLLWSLKALDANIIASLALYQTEIFYSKDGELEGESAEILKEALRLFIA
ncbi:MAG: NADPH-dependent FMN reductase [Bacteroidota bacterium]